ncbi:MAG: SpoIID/LytB domain-containing protein [Phycisphaerae bacterium]
MGVRIDPRRLGRAMFNRLTNLARRPATWCVVAGVLIPVIVIGCLQAKPAGRDAPSPATADNARLQVDRLMRVRLCGRHGTDAFTLAVNSGYVIEDRASGKILVEAAKPLTQRKVRVDGGGGIRIGSRVFPTGHLAVSPRRDAALVVNGAVYRGALSIRRVGKLLRINNEVDVDSYVPGVLAGELPGAFHADAFAALAVAARTYALYQKLTFGSARDFDVLPDERSQMYVGINRIGLKARVAAERTRGEVLTLPNAEGGGLFATYYASCCGGLSQPVGNVKRNDPAVSPLRGDVVCHDCRRAPHYRWPEVRMSKAELTRRLVARYPTLKRLGTITTYKPLETTPDGRIVRIRLIGSSGASETLIGEDFRLSVGGRTIKSTRVRLYDDGDGIVFYDGFGYGHGMGLCQHGANGMAKKSTRYRDILAHYYPDSVLRKLQ